MKRIKAWFDDAFLLMEWHEIVVPICSGIIGGIIGFLLIKYGP